MEQDLRLEAGIGFEEADRGEALEIGEAGRVLRQQDHRVRVEAGVVGPGEGDLAADDGLDAFAGAVLAEFEGAEKVA